MSNADLKYVPPAGSFTVKTSDHLGYVAGNDPQNVTIQTDGAALQVVGDTYMDGNCFVNGTITTWDGKWNAPSDQAGKFIALFLERAGITEAQVIELELGIVPAQMFLGVIQSSANDALKARLLPIRVKVAGVSHAPLKKEGNKWSMTTSLHLRIVDLSLEDMVMDK